MNMQSGSAWHRIIDAVTAPLGFFVLALLIVETFIATVLVGAQLDKPDKVTGMWLGVGLFIFVTLLVFVLVWFKPENLTFDKEAHLIGSGKLPYGSDGDRIDPAGRFAAAKTDAKGVR